MVYVLTPLATPREDPRLAGRGYRRSRSRSPPRRESYGSNPYRDERREDPRRGNFRRSPSSDRNFRGARDPPPGYRANDGETETMRVKSSLVGLIIGRNGENLRRVESETGARVQFIQAKDSHVAERQCTISGSLRARIAARDAINAIIEENGGQNVPQDKGAYTAGMPGRAKVNLPELREGEKSTQIMVPDKTVGLIIGRGGETIKDVQERSGCHVNIVGENKSVGGLRPVNLIGSEQATNMAKELILEIVESDNRGASGSGGGSGPNPPPPSRDRGYGGGYDRSSSNGGGGGGGGGGGRDHVEKTIFVPSEAVGMIIGKGGETIKDTQRTTGCKINVHQPSRPDVERRIDLAGTSRSMQEAERVIWEKVETVRQRDAAAGRSHGGRDQGPPSYGGYSQQQQAPAVPGYGSYMPPAQPQAPPQMPAFQVPQTTQPGSDGQSADPYAAWGGQAAVMAWYASQMANMQQGGQQPPGGAPGTQ
jgi:transcription antitermination factor NusA-like protein